MVKIIIIVTTFFGDPVGTIDITNKYFSSKDECEAFFQTETWSVSINEIIVKMHEQYNNNFVYQPRCVEDESGEQS